MGEEEEEERRFLSGPTEAQYAFGERILRGMDPSLFCCDSWDLLGMLTIVRPPVQKKCAADEFSRLFQERDEKGLNSPAYTIHMVNDKLVFLPTF